jgi:hypothetical protein
MSDTKKCLLVLNKVEESFSEISQQVESCTNEPEHIKKLLTLIKNSQENLVVARNLLEVICNRSRKLDPVSGLPRYGPSTMLTISDVEVNIFINVKNFNILIFISLDKTSKFGKYFE